MRMRYLLAAAMLAAAACGDDGGDEGGPTVVVSVQNNQFVPATLEVDAGTTVVFRWAAGSVNHNVAPWAFNTFEVPATPDLPALHDAPYEFGLTFPQQGVYRYFCQPHGAVDDDGTLVDMAGSISVR